MQIFNKDFLDIPYDAMDDDGGIIVCHDPQNRLKNSDDCDITWGVVRTFSNKQAAPKALGLFWDKEMAVKFGECL